MKTDKIVLGITLIILGILFLFANLHMLDWSFISGLWKLWPLVLILWGLDLMLKDSPLFKTILFLLIVLGAFVLYFYKMNGFAGNYSLMSGEPVYASVYSISYAEFSG